MPSALLATLADLVRINSVNPAYEGGPGEAEIARYVAEFFAARGIETWEQEVFPGRPNVIGRLPGRSARRLIFEAHTDTASATGMSIPPFEPVLRDGRLYGRGACDTKAGLSAMMHALASLQEDGVTPPCEIWVVAAADEEHSFRGVLKLCEGLQAAAAVVAEPTEMRLAAASKGVLRWRMLAEGRAAHSSKPHLGVNAITRMARLVLAIEADNLRLAARPHPLLGPATCNVGLIYGGRQVNFVPDGCTIEIDRRLLPGESIDEVLAHYAALGEARMEPPMLQDEPLETPLDAPIVVCATRILGTPPVGVPYGSDASKLSRAGIPAVIIGPGNIDQAHAAVEWVECAQVERACEFYRALMARFA